MYAVPQSPTGQFAYGGAVNHFLPDMSALNALFPFLVQYLGHWRHGYRTTALLFGLAYLDGDLLYQFYQYCLYYWPMLDEQERDLVRRIELKLGGYAGLSQEAMQAIMPIAGFGLAIEDGARMAHGMPTYADYRGLSGWGCAPCGGLGCGPNQPCNCSLGCGPNQPCNCGCNAPQGMGGLGAAPPRRQPKAAASMGLRNQGAGFGYNMQQDSPWSGGYGPYTLGSKEEDEEQEDQEQEAKQAGKPAEKPAEKPFNWGEFASGLAKAGIDIGQKIASALGDVTPAQCMQNPSDARCATMKLPDSPLWRQFCNTPNGRVFKPCINAGFVSAVPPSGATTPPAAGAAKDSNTMIMIGIGLLAILALGMSFMRGGM